MKGRTIIKSCVCVYIYIYIYIYIYLFIYYLFIYIVRNKAGPIVGDE